jgi:hypothetical protein
MEHFDNGEDGDEGSWSRAFRPAYCGAGRMVARIDQPVELHAIFGRP